jgi:hypothetical protein
MQVNVKLTKIIGFLVIFRSRFAKTPEFIGKMAIGELLTEYEFFTRKIDGPRDGCHQLVMLGVKGQGLQVGSAGDRITERFKMKCK